LIFRWTTVAALAVTVALVGCKGSEDDGPAFVPKTYTFQGKADPKFVGNWRSVDKNSGLKLEKDGSATIDAVSHSQMGSSDTKIAGNWLVDGDNLMLQYAQHGNTTVLKYKANLSGSSLTLQQDGGKSKIVYHK